MRNILIVNDERMTGGVSILLEDILKNIDKSIKIDLLILHNHGECLKELPSNISVIYGTKFFDIVDLNIKEVIKTKKISLILKKMYLVLLMKTGLIKFKIKKERKKILTKKYDVEIAFKDGFCGFFTGYGDSIKKIQWLHSDYSKKDYLEKYKDNFIKLFNSFDKFVAVSKPVASNFSKIYGQKEKIIVINNFLDTSKVINKSNEDSIKYDSKKLNLISVGRLHYDKGYHVLFNVLNKLNQNKLLDDVTFTLVGDGPEFSKLLLLKEQYELDNIINMVGNQINPYKYLKNADLFILSSFHESYGNVVIESLTLHVPVLATEVATIHEILEPIYGMIVNNDERSLYLGLKQLLTNRSKITKYKNNLKEYVYKNNEIIAKIESLLK